jgi:uncharacterized membrane protein YoaK (UPF0700 family)
MADDPNGRMQAARDLMKMTPEELVTYAVARTANDTTRQSLVSREFERRAAGAQYKTAIVSAVVGAVVGAVLTAVLALAH